MTATVYNGTIINDISAEQSETLYTNNTGKNVRIVFNYLETGSANVQGGSQEIEFYFGSTDNPDWDVPLPYTGLDTIFFSLPGGRIIGKHMNYHTSGGSSPTSSTFPLEIMMPDTHAIRIKIGSGFNGSPNSPSFALMYNFVAITED